MSAADWTDAGREHARYWDELADDYQRETRISIRDFHYGPLVPGDAELQLLPRPLRGLHCLELGCGAGQNSIYLASEGALCSALDISATQLAHGRRLADATGVAVDFVQGDLDCWRGEADSLDLIHSAYGLPFADNPAQVIRRCAEALRPGGRLLLSLGHPVYAGEWLELDGEPGLFLSHYFHPPPDVRESEAATAQARAFPVSECVRWLREAGLTLEDLREPPALPVQGMSTSERAARVPYDSDAWAEQAAECQRFPLVLILSGRKPASLPSFAPPNALPPT